MSPLGLLALALAVITFGGGAVVFLYDLLEARLSRAPSPGGGRIGRVVRVQYMQGNTASRGLTFTMKAGSSLANRGEVDANRVLVRRRDAY